MPTENMIVFSKFKIEVFSHDGTFIKEARTNKVHNFYCSGLTPGHKYVVIFSYDNILLLIADFTCDTAGNVIYLSPAHFVFNDNISLTHFNGGSDLATKVKRREEFNIPYQLWEKKVIESYISNQRGNVTLCDIKTMLSRFKAGAILAKSVRYI
jgi:hypothetical protein